MVIWIIGLSGAGKTTLANKVVKDLRDSQISTVLIDGDVIRDTFDDDLGHSIADRKINAERISKLCKFLDNQNLNVICSILSLFPESREWNRKNIQNYFEVFIDTPLNNLFERDNKSLYKDYNTGKIKNVAGMDLEFIPPASPDLLINNNDSLDNLLGYSNYICDIVKNSNL